MTARRRSRTWRRTRGQHVDTEVGQHAGLSLLLLIAPFVAVAVVLIWFAPEDYGRGHPAVWAVAALFFAVTWGAESLVVRLTRRRGEEE